ncbi:L10-interacting MYB domain-containing protein-like isoform X2 [Bidens hawaiensis]
MDGNRPNVVACETSTKKNKQKLLWNDAMFKEFIDACLLELRKGNRPGTHFNKVGWENIEKTMYEKTGKTLSKKQIKNKWSCMKNEWKLYDRLMSFETGFGGMRNLIDASPEWWEEKIKVDKDFVRFRDVNLDIFETHYAPLFRDSVILGYETVTPLQFHKDSNSSGVRREENIEGKGDSNEISLGDEPLIPSHVESSLSKRKKSKDVANKRSTKSKISSFKLDLVLDALSTKSTQTFSPNIPSPTIAHCMNIVITFPGFEEGSKEYLHALRAFIKMENREAFMYPTTHEAKMELLKLLME